MYRRDIRVSEDTEKRQRERERVLSEQIRLIENYRVALHESDKAKAALDAFTAEHL